MSRLCLLFLLLSLSYCASQSGMDESGKSDLPYVADPSPRSTSIASSRDNASSGNPAVDSLMAEADAYQQIGDFGSAERSLERALRIAPRMPRVHYRLAEVRLQLGQAESALQVAFKGQSLLRQNPALEKAFWRLIGDCYTALGNMSKANEAYGYL